MMERIEENVADNCPPGIGHVLILTAMTDSRVIHVATNLPEDQAADALREALSMTDDVSEEETP